jgi:hypothetical protein
VLFADDTSIIVTTQKVFQTALNRRLCDIISWFKANFLSFKFDKMNYLQFWTKNYIDTTLDITIIANVSYTKFQG